MKCPRCGGTDIETDNARGSQVCTSCGSVLEDNIIVSEVQFADSGGGSVNVVGQSVNSEGGHRPFGASGPTGFHSGYSRDSRSVTIDNGRKAIVSLAASLSLYSSSHIESAHRYFKLAVEHRFIQGRRTEYVVASCLYITCRFARTPHMLLDFADVLRVNVFTLGAVYLKLINRLNIRRMPIIDPSLFLLRFVNKLDFGDKSHEVAKTAIRLVARMKRDWMQTGRRPAGLCGAGILVAARLHGFSRSQKEVVNVVRVGSNTLRQRLAEFEDTPSSNLTVVEFQQIDLEGEADPPAFSKARKRDREQKEVLVDGVAQKEMERVAESVVFKNLDGGRESDKKTISTSDTTVLESATASKPWVEPQDNGSLSDLSDEELDSFILAEDEVELKSKIWHEVHKDFLEKQEAKARQAEADEQLGGKTQPKKKKKKRNTKSGPAASTDEAVKEMLAQKKVSKKINYAKLMELGIIDELPPEAIPPAEPTKPADVIENSENNNL
eukprot:m.5032 g.5032  ORF g.5032 m.5032 type:complete len:496 (+) comp3175_c0_seq1:157-1644(+)